MDRFDMPPQHDGQAKTMLICDGPKTVPAERGHWYSPEKVLELLAAEREECAKACESFAHDMKGTSNLSWAAGMDCAVSIRKRSNAEITGSARSDESSGTECSDC